MDLARVAHLEQIGVFSDPDRVPGARVMATGFLGLVPLGRGPAAAGGHRVAPGATRCRRPRSTTATIVERAHRRLQAKLSYTNIGFALAPAEFTIGELRRVYAAVLGARRRPDQPAAHPDPARDARADRQHGAARSGRGAAGRDVPVQRQGVPGDGSVRGVPAAGAGAPCMTRPRSGRPFQATRKV